MGVPPTVSYFVVPSGHAGLYESLGTHTGRCPVETQDLASLQLSCFVVRMSGHGCYKKQI